MSKPAAWTLGFLLLGLVLLAASMATKTGQSSSGSTASQSVYVSLTGAYGGGVCESTTMTATMLNLGGSVVGWVEIPGVLSNQGMGCLWRGELRLNNFDPDETYTLLVDNSMLGIRDRYGPWAGRDIVGTTLP